jgi:hypothetical protein
MASPLPAPGVLDADQGLDLSLGIAAPPLGLTPDTCAVLGEPGCIDAEIDRLCADGVVLAAHPSSP